MRLISLRLMRRNFLGSAHTVLVGDRHIHTHIYIPTIHVVAVAVADVVVTL
jgi:hypothetical protein